MSKISISTCYDYTIPILKQIEEISKRGFKYISFGSNYDHSGILKKENRKQIVSKLKELNLKVDTIHGCCTDDENCIEILEQLIKASEELEAPIIVIHPITGFEIEKDEIEEKLGEMIAVCASFKAELLRTGIKFGIENLFPANATEVVKKGLGILDGTSFGLCYDSSHDQVDGPRSFEFLEENKHRVIALHLSDRIKPFVDHVIPGEGFIDFDQITRILSEANYDGTILLELLIENSYEKDKKAFLKRAYMEGFKIENEIIRKKDLSHKITGNSCKLSDVTALAK